MNFWVKLEKSTYKRNQLKVQLVQNGPKGTKIDWVDQVYQIEPNKIKVDLIGLNRYCLIFRKKKLFSTILEKNYTLYYNYKIIIYFPASCGYATNFITIAL